jgi:plastocyanin
MNLRPSLRVARAIVLATVASACGGSSTAPSSAPTPPVASNTITITSSGVSPKNVQIAVGSRVLFINNDSRSHNMQSDPHPEHTDCPELETVGFLSPGQSHETKNFVTARTCGFHDHDDFSQQNLQGSIVIR